MTQADIRKYYADLLIQQYNNKTRARSTVELFANQMIADLLPQQIQNSFALNTAGGQQLEFIGKIVGVDRNVFGLDLSPVFFNFSLYTDATPDTHSFSLYADSDISVDFFRRYTDSAAFTLNDVDFLSLIKLKILYNNVYPSTKNIIDGMYSVFGTAVTVTDNMNMTATFTVLPSESPAMISAAYLGILPRPMAVEPIMVYL